MNKIKSKSITVENFKRFGKIVTAPTDTPTAQANDFKFWSDIANFQIEGETEIGICTVYKQPVNEINGLERHLYTPEILIPIDAPFVVPLSHNDDEEDKIEAFQVNIGEVVVIDEAVWHGASLPVGKDSSSYFVIFRRRTPFEDVEKKSIQPVEIEY